MELLYSMRRKPLKCMPPHFENALDTEVVRPICTISTCNIIAFSSPTELSDADGDSWGGHVYVCDLDTPWDSHKVTSTVYPVSSLEWDNEGKQLLVATTVGDISVFGQKDYLLNDWTCLYTAVLPGEHILKAIFYHNGRRVVATDKKSDLITEKFQMLRSTPTHKGFGGVWNPGALVVTGSGLVAFITPPAEGTKATVTMESLRPARLRILSASAAHKITRRLTVPRTRFPDGSIYVAYVCAQPGRCMVRAASCCPRPPTVVTLPAIVLADARPVTISWCHREDAENLLIAGTTITTWHLTERSHPIHKLLAKGPIQGSTTPGSVTKPASDCFVTPVWQQVAEWPLEECVRAVQVASNRAPLTAPIVLLATPSDLRLMTGDSHQWLCSQPVVTSGTGQAEVAAGAGTPPKKPKYGAGVLPSGSATAIVSSVDISTLSGIVVCVDSHTQLHVYRILHPRIDLHPSPLSIQRICTLLEYSMVSGYDCLDVLLTLKSNVIELVYERFTESFQRQPQTYQQYYYQTWLKLRIALCRLSSCLSSSASWLSLWQACGAAWAASAAALRHDDRADAAALLDDHDSDKALLALEAKPETFGDVSSLQALRRPLQRALDVALTALTSPQHQHHGYEISTDPTAINVLRKLVVLARASGLGGEALSRPLARLQASGPKHELQEECAQLLSQSSNRAWDLPPRCGISAPHGKPYPLYLEYGVEPEALRYAPEPPAHLQCDTAPTLAMDSIRHMYLGGGGGGGAGAGGGGGAARWRACGRCGARALPAAARHACQRAHDDRFLLRCRCGGKWTLVTNV